MKIRTGFVSNSSTTAFILVGIKVNAKQVEKLNKIMEEREKEDYNLPGGLDFLTEEGLLGSSVDIGDEDDIFEVDDSLLDKKIVAKEIKKVLGIKVTPKMYAGIRMS